MVLRQDLKKKRLAETLTARQVIDFIVKIEGQAMFPGAHALR
jgi:hypothetical protein